MAELTTLNRFSTELENKALVAVSNSPKYA